MSLRSSNTVWHSATITRERRELLSGHRSEAVWFTGLSGSGRSTIAHTVEEHLHQMGCHTFVFDGDNVRHGLCADLGSSVEDRSENIRRIGEMVKLFLEAGVIALTAFISPYRHDRERVRNPLGPENFLETYRRYPAEACEQHNQEGLYARARRGEIKDFMGISAPYEPPADPALILDTNTLAVEECVQRIMSLFAASGVVDAKVNSAVPRQL